MVEEGPYTLTLVAVDNVNGTIADFTSTLEVMVNDIEDGTTIVFNDRHHLTISKSNTDCTNYRSHNTQQYLQVPHLHHLM